ncbi:MAG: oxidoreductase, partial [Myxococcales bacterium]
MEPTAVLITGSGYGPTHPFHPPLRITPMRIPRKVVHQVRYAMIGVLAACVGVGFAHLVAAMLNPQSSPVLAIGATVIDLTPTPVKTWAIRTFGTADKPILIGSVLLGTLAAAGLIGIIAQRRRRLGIGLLALLVVPVVAVVLLRPGLAVSDLLPALAAVMIAPATLAILTRPRIIAPEGTTTTSRRGFLIGSGVALTLAAVAAGTGEWIRVVKQRISDIVLPRAATPLPDLPKGLSGVSTFTTVNEKFYRVDTKLAVPVVDHTSWSLTIDGQVDQKLTISYADLLAMPMVEKDITLTCVSNEVGGPYVGAARWLGVPLGDLLDRVGVRDGADQILSTDVDGFTISTPLDVATDGRDALIAVGMNGEVLPRKNGFPARLVVPGIYGFVGATKWLTRMTLTTYAAEQAYWT